MAAGSGSPTFTFCPCRYLVPTPPFIVRVLTPSTRSAPPIAVRAFSPSWREVGVLEQAATLTAIPTTANARAIDIESSNARNVALHETDSSDPGCGRGDWHSVRPCHRASFVCGAVRREQAGDVERHCLEGGVD